MTVQLLLFIMLYLILNSPGNYKRMDGSLDGSRGKVKMDPIAMPVGIGKHENSASGMDVQIFL